MKLPRIALSFVARVAGPLGSIRAWLPLTPQSSALLFVALYLLTGPVPHSSDIVSAALAFGLVAIVKLSILLVVGQGARLRTKSFISLSPPNAPVTPHELARVVLVLQPVRILPGTYLACSLEFDHEGSSPSVVKIFGSSSGERRVPLDLSLPHRGSWDVRGIRCVIRDIAGLAQFSWLIPVRSSILIAPPFISDTTLPLLSSTQRPGDLVTDMVHRHGDPFDIKPYHPSDGLKKIVWKAFAKSGELLSRHPEASMTPEGFVTIVVLARPQDDDLCGKAVAYVRSLKELKLDVVVGCEGSRGRALATDATQCEQLLIDSVWDAASTSQQSLIDATQQVLDYCRQQAQLSVRKLVLFVAGARVTDTLEADAIRHLAAWLGHQGIEPIFCLAEPKRLLIQSHPSLVRKTLGLFVSPSESESEHLSADNYRAFLTSCLARQWEVFI